MLKKRNGQSGSGAATLVAVIALLIVLYILFLPPDVRKDLLEEESDGPGGTGTGSGRVVTNLLTDHPGRLEQIDKLEIEHYLPAVSLFSLAGAEVFKKAGSIYVKNGIFDNKEEKLTFNIPDLDNTDNVLLSFSVKDAMGRLTVLLNGEEIYNNEISTKNVMPIELPKDSLVDSNVLDFKVSEVGFRFWRTNEYTLENVQVTGDVTDVTTRESKNVFVISQTEKFNLEKALLRFLPDCRQADVGILEIQINNRQAYSSVPECGVLKTIEFSPAILENGENKLYFSSNNGRYLIDQISITSRLKEIAFPVYFFDVSGNQYSDIVSGRDDVNLSMRFVDSQDFKRGRIYINGKTLSINTKDATFSKVIDNYIEVGQNGIRIEPDNTVLDIIELKVDIVRR